MLQTSKLTGTQNAHNALNKKHHFTYTIAFFSFFSSYSISSLVLSYTIFYSYFVYKHTNIYIFFSFHSTTLRYNIRSRDYHYPTNDFSDCKIPRHVEQRSRVYETSRSAESTERTRYGLCGKNGGKKYSLCCVFIHTQIYILD